LGHFTLSLSVHSPRRLRLWVRPEKGEVWGIAARYHCINKRIFCREKGEPIASLEFSVAL